ncbi:MAG TPA: poly-gamma-glutamate biosynthesis protein PgsC [Bacilli bacterium]|nr:poly-gamma-glutamate biosynthesis protein PgsC [Bacilli bacterium]
MGEILILGIILSILFYEMTDISPGGIIVPGVMVMYIQQIDRMIYTVFVSILTYLIVQFFAKYFIVYGKRKFALMIIVSLFVNILFSYTMDLLSINMLNVNIIGYTISGLIAYEMSKQGTFKTISGLTIVIGLLQLIVIVLSSLGVML